MPLITACFFLSGFAGLVYEVVWARQLGLFLGMTSYAHTAVITAYMAGLAGGSLNTASAPMVLRSPLKPMPGLKSGLESMRL